MSDPERTQRESGPAPHRTNPQREAEGPTSRFPAALRNEPMAVQQRALAPDAQPGFDAEEAARRPAGAPVQMKESGEAKGSGDAKPAKKPVTMKAMEVRPGEAITEVVVNAGTLKGLAEGDAVSVGHLSGHVVIVSEFRATVKFEAAPSVVQPVLDARGRVLQSGPATEAAPTAVARYAIDVKAPKVQKAPGKPSTVTVFFEVTPDGGKTERYPVSWSGRKERAAIVAEALAMLEVARVAIPAMSETVSADMTPYAEKIADAIMKHL